MFQKIYNFPSFNPNPMHYFFQIIDTATHFNITNQIFNWFFSVSLPYLKSARANIYNKFTTKVDSGHIPTGNTRGRQKHVQGKGPWCWLTERSLSSCFKCMPVFTKINIYTVFRWVQLAADNVNKQIWKKFPLKPGYR